MPDRVLVVDDEEPICEIMRMMLRNAGYDCQAAQGSNQALAILSAGQEFDVAAVNLMMPDLDGLGLIERMAVERPHLPVFLQTANRDAKLVLGCLRHGSYDY